METNRSFKGDGDYLFACYAHDDSEIVLKEVSWLLDEGLNVWYDEGIRAGADWRDEIAIAIEKARGVLFFGSKNSLASQFCMNEIHYALGMHKPLLAVFERPLSLPPGLALSLGSRQALFRNQMLPATYLEKLKEGSALLATGKDTAETAHVESTLSNLGKWIGHFLHRSRPKVERHLQPPSQHSPPAPQSHQEVPRILIMPFEPLMADQELTNIAMGIATDLISFFSSNPHVDVIHRSAGYSDQSGDNLALAKTNDAQYIIEGVIRGHGTKLQINMDLVEVNTGSTVWGRSFIEEKDKVMELQGQFIRGLSQYLGPALWQSEGIRVSRQQPASLRSWELVHRATFIEFTAYRRETAIEAEALVRLALESDPDYALGLSTLSRILMNKVTMIISEDIEADQTQATLYAGRAMELSPMDPQILMNTAVVRMGNGDIKQAVSLAQRALNMDPLLSGGLGFLGVALILLGQVEDGISTIEQEITRDPDNPRQYLSLANLSSGYKILGQFEKAEELMLEAIGIHPTFHMCWWSLAFVQVLFDVDKAAKSFAEARRLEPEMSREKTFTYYQKLIPDEQKREAQNALLEILWTKSEAWM